MARRPSTTAAVETMRTLRGSTRDPTLTSSSRIFRPESGNTTNDFNSPRIDYFAEDASQTFVIVGTRPPDKDDTVHKVGRTTGWTSGAVKNFEQEGGNDPSCPGDELDAGAHKVHADEATTTDDYYIECLVKAVFAVDRGDSGSPVFVYMNEFSTASARKVLLVGVIYGRRSTSIGSFIPIERIYAESLMRGYDWLPDTLRPVPTLDLVRETLELADDGSAIVATFDDMENDFSPGRGLTYQAVLHRMSGRALSPVQDANGDLIKEVVAKDDLIARFEVSRIPSAQRSGEFSVRVRLCPYVDDPDAAVATDAHCGGYGSDGDTSLTVPPAP